MALHRQPGGWRNHMASPGGTGMALPMIAPPVDKRSISGEKDRTDVPD